MPELNARQLEESRLSDYQTVFHTPEGKRVLQDLQKRYLYQHEGLRLNAKANNPLGLAYTAVGIDFVLEIMHWVECDIQQRLDTFFPIVKEDDPYGDGHSDFSGSFYATGDS